MNAYEKMKDEIVDTITTGFFVVLGILAIIITIAILNTPTKRTYKVYNDKNNYTIIEESR